MEEQKWAMLCVTGVPQFIMRGGKRRRMVEVQCRCGKTKMVRISYMIAGAVTDCGCSVIRSRKIVSVKDVHIGMQFGKLTVTSPKITTRKGRYYIYTVECRCECGAEKEYIINNLCRGLTQSCGCTHTIQLTKRVRTHNASTTTLYRRYASMKDRCYNKNNAKYHNYGGKGVSVCEEWLYSFDTFRQ